MKTHALAMTSLLAAACTATLAFGQWSMPFALSPVTVDQDKNVSIDFDHAPVSQVFDWLKKSGVNFVVETTDLAKNKRLTVHIKGQSKDKAIEAIADALGMSWSKKGDIYTLRNGAWSEGSLFGQGKSRNWTPEEAEKWSKEFGKEFSKGFKTMEPNGQAWEELSKKMADGWKSGAPGGKTWEEFGKQMEKSQLDQEQFKELEQGMKRKQMPEIEKMVQQRMKELSKLKGLEDGSLEKSVEAQAELEKALSESMKGLSKMKGMTGDKFEFKEMPDIEKMIQEHMKSMKDLPNMNLKLKELEKLHDMKMPDMSNLKELEKLKDMKLPDMELKLKGLEKLKDMKMPDMTKVNLVLEKLHKFVESVTPAQIEKNKKQGYLTLEDLTPEQRTLLGEFGDKEDMTMQFNKDGQRITIKRK